MNMFIEIFVREMRRDSNPKELYLVGRVQNDSPFPELETILYAPRF